MTTSMRWLAGILISIAVLSGGWALARTYEHGERLAAHTAQINAIQRGITSIDAKLDRLIERALNRSP